MPRVISSHVKLNPAQVHQLLQGRTGAVGRVMAGFAGLSTLSVRQVARERLQTRSGEYERSISSTTEGAPGGVNVVTTIDVPYAAAIESGSQPHVIEPVEATVLRFEASGGDERYRPSVMHPGTQPYHVLRDGVRRAGRRLRTIAVRGL